MMTLSGSLEEATFVNTCAARISRRDREEEAFLIEAIVSSNVAVEQGRGDGSEERVVLRNSLNGGVGREPVID
ncbi:MAG: hypothetical protein M1305_03750 [Candidatus Marsarchaeota archaeon]|nr:hypothetical protein [Candidatus Marsarchaeota archaeon]